MTVLGGWPNDQLPCYGGLFFHSVVQVISCARGRLYVMSARLGHQAIDKALVGRVEWSHEEISVQ